tara:strand:+ start:1246 stop:2382 length:1137 start_codon:yes stop_codon:yes gene_type:complete
MIKKLKILITGSNGFIGKNFKIFLKQSPNYEFISFNKEDKISKFYSDLENIDFIFHAAGVNRTKDKNEFKIGNIDLTNTICKSISRYLKKNNKLIPIVYLSSIMVNKDTPYGKSKLAAENSLKKLSKDHNIPLYIYRLPNVFGKWSRPNYNSVVATFCYKIARNQEIKIHDPHAEIDLLYIDDLIKDFENLIKKKEHNNCISIRNNPKTTTISVGKLAKKIYSFHKDRKSLKVDRVGNGFTRALYATYLSYLPQDSFKYSITMHKDPRGAFAEIIKTIDSGQISFFTAFPGVTRGIHYHHTKSEKFIVISGKARFNFKDINTNKRFEVIVSGHQLEVIDSIPGWVHSITNIGDEELMVLLWANEVFDKELPDTFIETN